MIKPKSTILDKIGEFDVDPATTAYFGGQPCGIFSTGMKPATDSDTPCGLFRHDSVTDLANGKAAFYAGYGVIFQVYGTLASGADAPYDTTKTYGIQGATSVLRADASALLSNDPALSGDIVGQVLVTSTDPTVGLTIKSKI